MESAERNGDDFFRWLASAECFNDRAIRLGSFQVKTPGSRSSALLFFVTRCDHFAVAVVFFFVVAMVMLWKFGVAVTAPYGRGSGARFIDVRCS